MYLEASGTHVFRYSSKAAELLGAYPGDFRGLQGRYSDSCWIHRGCRYEGTVEEIDSKAAGGRPQSARHILPVSSASPGIHAFRSLLVLPTLTKDLQTTARPDTTIPQC